MADPLKSEDIYIDPDLAPVPPALPGTPPSFGELPPAPSRLNNTAGSLGSSVGTAVRRLRVVRRRTDVVSPATDESSGTMDELKDAAQEHIQDWRDSSRRAIHEFRHHVHRLRYEYPLQTILAFGAVGFVVGAILRTWRSK